MKPKDYKKYRTDDATPGAASMIESFRAVGYSLPAAIADIIDNSIAAGSENLWVDYEWDGEDSFISMTDDGQGMDKKELVNALRPGSKNPLADRDESDLGRFGLGLKTASFSQCRHLTVATKRNKSGIIHRCWDLEYVKSTDRWEIIDYLSNEKLIKKLKGLNSGTCVIWEDIDRLVGNTKKNSEFDHKNFLEAMTLVKKHLAMIFHLYIEKRKLTIWINDRKLASWNPYLESEKDTKKLDTHELAGKIKVKPFVLPHHSKLDRKIFESASGIKGWNSQQGFYIYRNGRLIVAGDWLGMYKQEEHYKLARIMIDIPNTVATDTEWQLDIKKSGASPPPQIRPELRKIAEDVRKVASDIYRQVGNKKKQKSATKEDVLVWTEQKRKGKRFYQINREHPLVKSFIDENTGNAARINRVLRLIEETIPVSLIFVNESENQDYQVTPFEGKATSDMVSMIVELYELLVRQGYSKSEAIKEILHTEPFNHYPELTENISA